MLLYEGQFTGSCQGIPLESRMRKLIAENSRLQLEDFLDKFSSDWMRKKQNSIHL